MILNEREELIYQEGIIRGIRIARRVIETSFVDRQIITIKELRDVVNLPACWVPKKRTIKKRTLSETLQEEKALPETKIF